MPTPPFNAKPRLGDLTSDGFFFDTESNAYQLANNSASVDNGTTYLVTLGEPLSRVTFSQVGDAPLALTSFDYAEWQEANTAHQITVTGNLVGGGTISMLLPLDLVFDGPPEPGTLTLLSLGSAYLSVAVVVTVASANRDPRGS